MFWILEETNLFEGVWKEKEVCQNISSARPQPDTNRLLLSFKNHRKLPETELCIMPAT